MSRVEVSWLNGVAFVGETESGHAIVMDGAPESGGRNLGARPMELLLTGLGGCTAFDVVTILRKARQPVQDVKVVVSAERAETIPKVYTKIHIHFVVYGDVAETHVRRAVELSAEKYCSASQMLAKAATLTHDYEIRSGTRRNDELA
ncbi:MAG: OsmC family protein [Thioalkalivibrionaceae bacterium]